MSQSRKSCQRAKRKEKRHLKHKLIVQAKNNKNIEPIGRYINLGKGFIDYAVSQTESELKTGEIEYNRMNIIKEVLKLVN